MRQILFRARVCVRNTFLTHDLEEVVVLLELIDDPIDERLTILRGRVRRLPSD